MVTTRFSPVDRRKASPRRRPPHRAGHAPLPRFADGCAALAGLGLGAVVALVIASESRGTLAAPGGWLTAAGRLSGFVGGYLLLMLVLLMARIPWLERSVGQDKLVRWHRRLGPWTIWLITAHVALVVWGYSKLNATGLFHQLFQFVRSYPDMLAALVAYGLLVMVGVVSIRISRRRLKYETWWIAHLYAYLAVALAFAHQMNTGVAFLSHPLTRMLWAGAWIAAAACVLLFRVGLPVLRNLQHRLEVVEVTEEGPGVYSVVCMGRNLSRLAVSGGQFFQWRFMTKELWWHAHPFSLSALPVPPTSGSPSRASVTTAARSHTSVPAPGSSSRAPMGSSPTTSARRSTWS